MVDNKLSGYVHDDGAYLRHNAVYEQISEIEQQNRHYPGKDNLSAVHRGRISVGQRVEQLCRYRCPDYRHDPVEQRHEHHHEQYPRTRLPHKAENVKQTVTELRPRPPYVPRNLPQTLRLRLTVFSIFVPRRGRRHESSRSHLFSPYCLNANNIILTPSPPVKYFHETFTRKKARIGSGLLFGQKTKPPETIVSFRQNVI